MGGAEKGRRRVKEKGGGWFNGSQEEGWCLARAPVSGRLYSSKWKSPARNSLLLVHRPWFSEQRLETEVATVLSL